MEKIKIEQLLKESYFQEMITTQLTSWELTLQKKGLAKRTIDRKIKNILDFYVYLITARLKNKDKRIKADEMSSLAYEFIRDGLYSNDNYDNCGIKEYRESIYNNIKDGINYIYENYFNDRETIINPLTSEQREVLQEISHNKFYKHFEEKESTEDKYYESIQLKVLKEFGVQVYFDEYKKPFVYSHELAELINKPNKDVMKSTRLILERYSNFTREKIFAHVENLDISMVEDTYKTEIKNNGSKENATYRLSKDLVMNYILGLTGEKFSDFRFMYQSAFNYIESEIRRHIEEKAQLKESFLNMYNEIRKKNRDLYVYVHNEKCKMKKAK